MNKLRAKQILEHYQNYRRSNRQFCEFGITKLEVGEALDVAIEVLELNAEFGNPRVEKVHHYPSVLRKRRS